MLQLITMISMFIDHIGVAYEISWFRIIGRIAMPLYGYFIYQGFEHTHDRSLYMRRLAILAFISQMPYSYFFGYNLDFSCNIIGTWLLCVLLLDTSKKADKYLYILFWIAVICTTLIIPFEYSFIPVLWVFLWKNLLYGKKIKSIILLGCIVISSCFLQYQIFSLAALPLVYLFRKYKLNERLPYQIRYLWRCFYPLQFTLLGVIK